MRSWLKTVQTSMRHAVSWLTAGSIGAALLVSMGLPARAQQPSISVEGLLDPTDIGPGDRATVGLTIHIPEGWHLWSFDPGPGPLPLKVKVVDGPIAFDGPWHGDAPQMKFDRGFKRELAQYEGGPVHLYRNIKLDPNVPPGPQRAELLVDAQICSANLCIKDPAKVTLKLNVHPSSTGIEPAELPGVLLSMATKTPPAAMAATAAAVGSSEWLEKAKAQGLWRFILWAFAAGLLALATPCVFPAIPLTLSFFSKYSEESFSRSLRLAATYAGTMVATFTVVGIVVSIVFGATEVQRFSQHPIFNLFLGVVLVFFGLNLLGLFEIQVPQGFLQAINRLENRFGAGARLTGGGMASGWGDYVVVSIAALTATTVFFTCTVAFVGNVIVAAASGEWFWPTIGMLAFGAAFALPFFLLALFPQAAQKMSRRSGGWLGATQVTLGFLELAAAAKFFSNVDLVWKWGFITREAVLALWVPLFALCGLFLLGKLAIGHKSLASDDGSVSVTQMLASMAMFGLALYLAAGMFSGRSFPSWISAWLPPSTYPSASGGGQLAAVNGPRFQWVHDLAEARKRASTDQKLVFVNYTGYTCTNCRFMEESVFPTPSVAEHLDTMTLVELYTDDGSPSNEWAREDQLERFKTVALPFYSVELADGTVVATYPGSADNATQFAQFLAQARAKAATMRPSSPSPTAQASPIRLVTTGLFSGQPAVAITPGKWNLVNFWATWCGPCKEELQGFMVRMGRDFEKNGGRFAVVAVEDDDGLASARSFAQTIALPPASALRLPSEPSSTDVDPEFEFTGSLPLTVLISPTGKVVWRHAAKITEDELKAVIVEHLGHASL